MLAASLDAWSRVLLLVAALATGAVVVPAEGAIIYLTQRRYVQATYDLNNNPTGGNRVTSPGFADFHQDYQQTFPTNVGSAAATQDSVLAPGSISFGGSSTSTLSTNFTENIGVVGESVLDITFQLTASTSFQVEHTHSTVGDYGSRSVFAQLIGLSSTLFTWFEDRTAQSTWPASPYSGMLQPGQYRLYIQIHCFRGAADIGGTNNTAASFTLSVPVPGSAGFGLLASAVTLRRQRR